MRRRLGGPAAFSLPVWIVLCATSLFALALASDVDVTATHGAIDGGLAVLVMTLLTGALFLLELRASSRRIVWPPYLTRLAVIAAIAAGGFALFSLLHRFWLWHGVWHIYNAGACFVLLLAQRREGQRQRRRLDADALRQQPLEHRRTLVHGVVGGELSLKRREQVRVVRGHLAGAAKHVEGALATRLGEEAR